MCRLLDILMQIYLNFWLETEDNCTYKALYMACETLGTCKPREWFSLPKIQKKLEEAASNISTYSFWGKGNGYKLSSTFFVFIDKKNH